MGPRIIHQDIQPGIVRDGLVHAEPNTGSVQHIGLLKETLPAIPHDALDRAFRLRGAKIGDADAGAFPRHCAGASFADAARSPGYDGDFPIELARRRDHHFSSARNSSTTGTAIGGFTTGSSSNTELLF